MASGIRLRVVGGRSRSTAGPTLTHPWPDRLHCQVSISERAQFIDSSVQLTGPTQTHADFIVEPLIRFDLLTSDSMQNNVAS
jgi:hypothetical protein